MEKITVKTERPYDVLIGDGLLNDLGTLVKGVARGKRIAVFSDDNLGEYLRIAVDKLAEAGFEVCTFVVPHGEHSKCAARYIEGLNFLAEQKFDRTGAVIALGGGVVGDLSGFVASTYMRGIDYIQVPTSLLAQVDSSVGGKTAIDLEAGKNLVGTFYQPGLVVADIATLNTLPESEKMNGIGELIKYAVLDGGEMYELMLDGFEKHKERIIMLAVDSKRRIVEADEKESGVRRLLNLGHTLAHSIEKLSRYTVGHGSSVATGLSYILEASRKNEGLSEEDYNKISALLVEYGVARESEYSLADMCAAAAVDKKAEGDFINLVVIKALGDCRVVKIAASEMEEYLA